MFVQIQIIGHITRDADQKEFASSKKSISGIAYTTGFGEKKKTHFLDVEAWGAKSDILKNYASKGTRVCLSGVLEQQEWSDKTTGSKRSKHVMVINDIVLLSPKDKTEDVFEDVKSTSKGELDLSKFKLPF